MYLLELAKPKDIAESYAIIKAAKLYQREQGFTQWTDDYPNETTIRNDVETKKGYVITADDEIAGYVCVDFSGEPAYEDIKGEWNTGLPYAVIHRMAFSEKYRCRGLSGIALYLIENLCFSKNVKNIRVDTDFKNKKMQHILEKGGFSKCGIVIFQGSEKLAYDKVLQKADRPAGAAADRQNAAARRR